MQELQPIYDTLLDVHYSVINELNRVTTDSDGETVEKHIPEVIRLHQTIPERVRFLCLPLRMYYATRVSTLLAILGIEHIIHIADSMPTSLGCDFVIEARGHFLSHGAGEILKDRPDFKSLGQLNVNMSTENTSV